MKRYNHLQIGLLGLIFAGLAFIFTSEEAEAVDPVDDCAIIIVSSYDPSDLEQEKAGRYYSHLMDTGYVPGRVQFLSFDLQDDGVDGYSSVSNIEDAFEEIASLSDEGDRVCVYISDHAPPPLSNSTNFLFSDGTISFDQVGSWIGSIEAEWFDIYIGGNHSGRAGPYLDGLDRTVVCSMQNHQSFVPDNFDLERSLSDQTADTDLDGTVCITEAYWKEVENLESTGQDPVLY